ncbi:hypothetical protein RhiirC2_791911 [Rhizophagus irregularis]|uniref:DUF4218 domain-containing protein n=1 Tax=Rhizophagus irregularis TaxID=588596 RepID=A0A2N1MI97_9GLOM|nr:hypothetical protein RhiirC2_791911 [Rhizophagus irregularis]
MWDLLSVNDREILGNFVKACSLLVCQIINTNEINEDHNRLLKIGQLIEEHYGENLITLNIHLSLHIAECCHDYGNQKLVNGLKLIEPRQTASSLAAYNDLRSEELVQFKRIFCSELEDTITGSKIYLGNLLIVQPIINQCGRIRVAAEIFGSALAPRYKKNSYILAKFTQDNESIELYPGMVQFYFEHVLRLPTIAEQDDDRSVNIELWKLNEFYEMSRDSIIPIHNIYSRFIPTNFTIGTNNNNNNSRRKAKTYMD